ncbi:unnamed protein product [Ostreobium quekettii]|uniref:Uncharacterized protein n=1 Tax=Ostreobium quekettii TaxID=121088 RepID=A0A8S1IYG5_9CHLO|nr:unnamed protein product [Ostreobium quekettii]|eukprot:evm.model.scf_235.2 EVM.evm.TU.scf_235.2   scf_235:19002-21241(+)
MARNDSFAKTTGGDPRRPPKKYNRPVTSPDDQPPDPMLLMALVFGILALLMKMKVSAWCSLFCCISSLANMKIELMDFKHVFSSVTLCGQSWIPAQLLEKLVLHERNGTNPMNELIVHCVDGDSLYSKPTRLQCIFQQA